MTQITAQEINKRSHGFEEFNFFHEHEFVRKEGVLTTKVVAINDHFVWVKHTKYGKSWQERSADMSQSFLIYPAKPLKAGDVS